jgi:hypothetical protein
MRWAAIVTALSLIATAWYLSRGPRDVTVDSAVERFRDDAQAEATKAPASAAPERRPSADDPAARSRPAAGARPSATTAPVPQPGTGRYALPPQGVYVYATKGHEQTDALAGARHTYPNETSTTFRKGGCGWISRWQPLEERWEESEFCESAQGTRMKRYTMYHEFFQRGVREDFACDGFVQKVGARAGDNWSMVCKSPQSTAKGKVSVVGLENVEVAGTVVKALHMRYDITVSGNNRGRMVQHRWLSERPRVMPRMTQTADLKVDSPFGVAGYKESYELKLRSLEPRT